jgi:hypothetical protein
MKWSDYQINFWMSSNLNFRFFNWVSLWRTENTHTNTQNAEISRQDLQRGSSCQVPFRGDPTTPTGRPQQPLPRPRVSLIRWQWQPQSLRSLFFTPDLSSSCQPPGWGSETGWLRGIRTSVKPTQHRCQRAWCCHTPDKRERLRSTGLSGELNIHITELSLITRECTRNWYLNINERENLRRFCRIGQCKQLSYGLRWQMEFWAAIFYQWTWQHGITKHEMWKKEILLFKN